jgi:hypothetical protein
MRWLQASGFLRVRDRCPGTVSRSSDPIGSGFYVFCGVLWLDPDSSADVRLIADGLARLEADFPHLRGATTLNDFLVVIRQKRSAWAKHLQSRIANNFPVHDCKLAAVCRQQAKEYPEQEGFLAPPRRLPNLHGAYHFRDSPDARESCPTVSFSHPASAFAARSPTPLHPWHAGALLPGPDVPAGQPLPLPRDVNLPLPTLPLAVGTSWGVLDKACRSALLPGPPDYPWAWYPPALPPTPPAPAAGVTPPADWPSPRA